SPSAVAVNQTNGRVFVADEGNKLVKVFTSEGKFIEAFKGGKFLGFAGPRDVAIDSEGHLWVLDGATVEELSSEGTFIRRFGKEGSEAGQFKGPEALALDKEGNVWVADTGNNRIQEFKSNGEFVRSWGTSGTEAGKLSAPRGLAFDSEGDLWVADSANDRLQRFTAAGTYLAGFGTPGNNAGEFVEPRGLAIDAKGRIWIADTGNNRVQEASGTETLRTFGGAGQGAGNLSSPNDVATDNAGNLWVADTAHNRVQEFNAEGKFIREFGTYGTANGEFNSPTGIAVNQTNGRLYVADKGNKLVKVFTSEGKFLEGFKCGGLLGAEPRDVALDPEGHLWVLYGSTVEELSSEGAAIRHFGSSGSEAGQFSSPEALALDAAGNVWVADTGNNRVQEFKPNGEFIRKWGTAGSGTGQLSAPWGLAFDSEGDLWVSDSANDRLQRFAPEGSYLGSIGTPGNNPGEFVEPRGLAIDAKGNLWAADAGNDRVQEFSWPVATTAYGYDQAGDLTSVARPKAGENPAIEETLAYDATGLLTAKTIGATTRHLAWDESTNLPLLLNDGEASYVYGPGGLPIEQINAKEEPTYLHHDQLGSTRLITGSGGATSATASYTPYGGLEAKTGTATSPLGFAGQYTDAETGLQYLRARFYDPGTGQFLSRDPLAALTRQPYSYAVDNPLNWTDPSGLYGEVAAGGCGVGEVIDPLGGCVPGAVVGGAGELAWATSGALVGVIAGALSNDEGSGEESDCKPVLEPPVDPWEYETEIGVPDQEMTIARKEVEIDRMGADTNPQAPGPGGSPRAKAVKAAALLALLYESLHHH
ncbi:MAG: 6-bladed beta-propeller, partial [Solirubrobacterales bacterium]